MDFQLAHVGLATDRQAQAVDFYCRGLGMLPLVGSTGQREPGTVWLANSRRGDFLLEIHSPSASNQYEASRLEAHGACLDHLHFWVADVPAAYDYLRGRGCPSRREPLTSSGRCEAAIYDPQGVEIWLQDLGRREQAHAITEARASAGEPDADLYAELHHVGILTPDRQTAIDFYTRVIGMQIRSRFYSPGSIDVTYLTDSVENGTYLQIEGPPHLPYAESYLARRGPGLNHLHFAVEDLDSVFSHLLAHGATENIGPYRVENTAQGHVFDPSGIDLQLIRYPPDHLLRSFPTD
jgi:catechol 2,3-dioxygenase-like lactoylglutathione lyase family enzyme